MATTPMDVSILVLFGTGPSMLSIVIRFVTLFWPKKVKAGKLEEIHAKMITKEGPRAPSADGTSAAKKPRLSTSANSRGGGSSASTSTSHTNGKYR